MKKILLLCFAISLLASCNNRNPESALSNPDPSSKPLFADFMYNFSSDEEFQKEHVRLPLPFYNEKLGGQETIDKWEPRKLGFALQFSSILFNDTMADYEREFFFKESDSSMVVSVFHLYDELWNPWYDKSGKTLFFWNYHFELSGDTWLLSKVVATPFEQKRKKKESFFHFLVKFATDIDFHKERIHSEATFLQLDESMEKMNPIAVDIENIELDECIYIETFVHQFDFKSPRHVLYVKGEGAGYDLTQYFEMHKGKWYLVKEVNKGV